MEKVPRVERRPTVLSASIFRAKATLLQLIRAARNLVNDGPVRFPAGDLPRGGSVIAQSISPLWTNDTESERHLTEGKVHNLRLALRRLNGVVVPAGKTFSFWAQVGRASKRKGYVKGRELREGCLIPTIGGGLCQLSSALYDAALRAGFEIVERHAHSEIVPGSLAEVGRDATIFWNYVDLRFKATHDFKIDAVMTADSLSIRIISSLNRSPQPLPVILSRALNTARTTTPQSCASCDQRDCFRHTKQ